MTLAGVAHIAPQCCDSLLSDFHVATTSLLTIHFDSSSKSNWAALEMADLDFTGRLICNTFPRAGTDQGNSEELLHVLLRESVKFLLLHTTVAHSII